MRKIIIALSAALSLCTASAAFATGAVKPEHPCYDVADCKSKASRKEFSACIKENSDEAKANTGCADFRKDKPAYLQEHGLDDVDALFEAG